MMSDVIDPIQIRITFGWRPFARVRLFINRNEVTHRSWNDASHLQIFEIICNFCERRYLLAHCESVSMNNSIDWFMGGSQTKRNCLMFKTYESVWFHFIKLHIIEFEIKSNSTRFKWSDWCELKYHGITWINRQLVPNLEWNSLTFENPMMWTANKSLIWFDVELLSISESDSFGCGFHFIFHLLWIEELFVNDDFHNVTLTLWYQIQHEFMISMLICEFTGWPT
jgi:hypothetical protein